MEKNYFFQEIIPLEPKRKTIKFLLNYSKSIKSLFNIIEWGLENI
jgi:hypothetical protein